MRILEDQLIVSPTDLSGFLACEHLTQLEVAVARGELERPDLEDAELDLLFHHGLEHEKGYLEELRSKGLSVVELDGRAADDFRAS